MRITEDLIRKRSEHNEKVIATLEELSLHQQDIEKIEHLDRWCRDLQILYLQSNLIPKIENVGRLKKLVYLNLALNNIEAIENLEGCESLEKLDLTMNFVGNLTDVEKLRANVFFTELYLTGNPCTDYEGYRQLVIGTLPTLERLDGLEIEKSERILATQALAGLRPLILQQQNNYRKKREREKSNINSGESNQKNGTDWYSETQSTPTSEPKIKELDEEDLDEEEKNKRFWEEKTPYTPESRLEVHRHIQETKEKEDRANNPPKPEKKRRLQTDDGRILNINEAKVNFTVTEDHANVYLDVHLFKFLDTSLCDVDVQPLHVKVLIKGQVLQLTLPEEVKPDSSTAKRSQTTGYMLITMPKLNPVEPERPAVEKKENVKKNGSMEKVIEKLEIDPKSKKQVDIANIVKDRPVVAPLGARNVRKTVVERPNSAGFEDDPDVPPLM